MKLKHLLAVPFAVAAISVVGMSGASAGEVTGNGDPTPINGYRAGSICSFSGLNDDPTGGGDPFQDGRVQSWGKVVADAKTFIATDSRGISSLAKLGALHDEGPGTNCRGYASGG
jgi:hypothetical protein